MVLHAAEQDRADIARRRARWRAHQGRFEPHRLVFLDETWVKTNMAHLRGWSPRGRRLIEKAPHGHWRTMTFLAALRVDRIEAPCVRRPGAASVISSTGSAQTNAHATSKTQVTLQHKTTML